MKTKYVIYIAAVIIIVIIGVALTKTRQTSDSALVAACLQNGGVWDMTRNTCSTKNASVSGTNEQPASKPSGTAQTSTKPAATTVSTTGKYTVHVSRGGDSVYYSPSAATKDLIKVYNPPTNTIVTSPLTISGEARGSWLTGSTAPVILTDLSGRILAQGTVKALNNWQTDNFIAFLGTLTFPRQPTGSSGVLIVRSSANSSNAIEILVSF